MLLWANDFRAVFWVAVIPAALCVALLLVGVQEPERAASAMRTNPIRRENLRRLGGAYWWVVALGAVFISGVIFVIITSLKIREQIVNAIPHSLKLAISAGVGLFLAIIGLKGAGVITGSEATMVTLGNVAAPTTLLAVFGFFVIVALEYRKVTGAIIIGVLLVTLLSVLLGMTEFKGVFAAPPSIEPTFMKMDIASAINAGLIGVIFIFFFIDLFDTTGTLIGVSHRAGLLDKDGKLPRLKRALFADSTAIMAGGVLGTSSVTAYVESAAGTSVGGRTGLTAVVVALLFLAALFLSPLAGTVPAYATAPALCYVAVLMTRGLAEIDWDDLTESAPAVITAVGMPFTYSIADGIAFGFISYAVIKVLAGRFRDLSPMVLVIAALFAVKFAFFH